MTRSRFALLEVLAIVLCASSARAVNCDSTSKGFTPLMDLGTGTYQGFEGGLYAQGSNVPPAPHLSAGVAEALQLAPLDSLGAPDAQNGWIVLLSIGMCNTSQEYTEFTSLANGYSAKNPRVFLLNGAQGGQTASRIADPNAQFWTVIDGRLAAQGLSREQVQAVWFKEANAMPTESFPTHADSLRNQFLSAMRIIRSRYTNARLCYFSSRIYAGYASSLLNPEPYAYESAFAAKWLIESQIAGNDSLNFDPADTTVVAPWLAWGPYLWADGLVPRSDGLTWLCSDFSSNDGTHPAAGAREKVANALLDFLTTDPTAAPWFLSNASGTESPPPGAVALHVGSARPNPFAAKTTVIVDVSLPLPVRVDVITPSGRRLKTLATRTLSPGQWSFDWDGTDSEGRPVGSGTYFLRVQGGDAVVRSEKVTLAR